MERGREVEGVWNSSGRNTPVPASRENSESSSFWSDLPLKRDHLIDVEKQEMASIHDRSASNSTTTATRPVSSILDRTTTAERTRSHHASRDSSPDAAITRPSKSRHPPSALSKYDITPYVLRQDSASLTLKGIDAVHDAFGTMGGHGDGSGDDSYGSNESSNHSSHGSGDADPISAHAPRLLSYHPRLRQHSTDLDLMQNHRMSQAAETGQLTPRVRKSGRSGDWANFGRGSQGQQDLNDYFSQERRHSPSPTEEEQLAKGKGKSPLMLPKIDTLPAAVRRSSLPDVTPFAKFCQTAPTSPISRPVSADDKNVPRLRTDSQSIYTSAPSSPATAIPLVELPAPVHSAEQPRAQQPQPQPSTEAAQQKRASFERRASAVVRGHGTGFEILKAGTLNPVIPGETPLEKQRYGPPISLHNSNTSRPRSSSTDSRRKLRKKRWPSADGEPGIRASIMG